MKCNSCGGEVAEHEIRCHICMSDIGFPNVRAANTPEEKGELDRRLADAMTSAKARGCESILHSFGASVLSSAVVVSRALGLVKNIVESENQLITSFYRQVDGGSRLPEDNRFDRARPSVDGVLFPYYGDQIIFGALSLDGVGVGGSYGACHLTLRESAVANRSSLFEENSLLFCTMKHRIILGGRIPPGYRATWNVRDRLAMAKHQPDLDATVTPDKFPGILVRQGAKPENEVFIEVHIYGRIHRDAIEAVVFRKPTKGPDLAIWNSFKKALVKRGVRVAEVP
ncbi:MAG: hypothetical protein JWN40_97 [Phycisphaerales bacterium]|nr:hypothetical protein [Phycisphaerales bacterium]